MLTTTEPTLASVGSVVASIGPAPECCLGCSPASRAHRVVTLEVATSGTTNGVQPHISYPMTDIWIIKKIGICFADIDIEVTLMFGISLLSVSIPVPMTTTYFS